MIIKAIKSLAAVGIIAGGATFTTATTANAASYGVYIGGNGGSFYVGSKRRGHGGGFYVGNKRRGHGGGQHLRGHKHRHHGHNKPRRRNYSCSPSRALNKAYNLGVYRAHIDQISSTRIVVRGYNSRHKAKVVFDRQNRHCRVIKTRGLNQNYYAY